MIRRTLHYTIIFIFLFIVIISFPFGFLLSGHSLKVKNINEKRVLTQKPKLKNLKINDIPSSYENYINDNLPLRTLLIDKYINIWEYHLSTFIRTYVKGKDQHVFPNYTEAPTIERYLGLRPLPRLELDLLGISVAGRQEFWNIFGVDYYYMFIPDKATLYPEYLPKWIKKNHGWYENVHSTLKESNINLIDIGAILFENKKNGLLYDKIYDTTHWNGKGLDIAYKAILNSINEKPYFSKNRETIPYKIGSKEILCFNNKMDTVPWMYLNTENLYILKNDNIKLKNNFSRKDVIINTKVKKGTLLFITDSYFKATHQEYFDGANEIIFPLAQNFHKYIHIHTMTLLEDLINIAVYEKPDIVIESTVERMTQSIKDKNIPKILIAGERSLKHKKLELTPNNFMRYKNINCHIKMESQNALIQTLSNDPQIFIQNIFTDETGRLAIIGKLNSDSDTFLQLYYATDDESFNGKRCVLKKINKGINYIHILIYTKPNKEIKLRLDPSNKKGFYEILPLPTNEKMFKEEF